MLQQTSDLISHETIESANIALWKVTQFNQLVQQQTDFHLLHAAELQDRFLKSERRELIARADYVIALMIHRDAIGDSKWFPNLLDALDGNIEQLDGLLQLTVEDWKVSRGGISK